MTGYRRIPAKDPKEQQLRDEWHAAKDAMSQGDEFSRERFEKVNDALSAYVQVEVQRIIKEDRMKHPKAKRNSMFEGAKGAGRAIP